MSVADVEEFLAADIEEGLFATGGQFYASVGGDVVVDLALGVDGLARPVVPDTLFATYCSGKPVLATALGCLIDEGELSLDDQLGDLVDRELTAELSQMLVGDLLNHTSGLHEMHMYDLLGASPRALEELVSLARPVVGWRVGQDVGYVQAAAWELLGWAVGDLCGMPVRDYVAKTVLGPLGVQHDLFVAGMSEEEFARHRERLGVNVYLRGTDAVPILAEQNRRFRCLESPAAGTTASARGLGRFYESVLRDLGGAGVAISADQLEVLTSLQSHGEDAVMGRTCGYGFGFMVQLEDHDFGRRCSARSFGHTAYGGMTAAFCDPEADLVVAFHFNARVDAESAVMYRRPALVERLYRAVLDEV